MANEAASKAASPELEELEPAVQWSGDARMYFVVYAAAGMTRPPMECCHLRSAC